MTDDMPREIWAFADSAGQTWHRRHDLGVVFGHIHYIRRADYDALEAENAALRAALRAVMPLAYTGLADRVEWSEINPNGIPAAKDAIAAIRAAEAVIGPQDMPEWLREVMERDAP